MLAVYALCMVPPIAAGAWSGAKWWHDRRVLTKVFLAGRERRLHP